MKCRSLISALGCLLSAFPWDSKPLIQALAFTETSGTGHSVPFLARLTPWSSTYAWELSSHSLFPPGKKGEKECKATVIS